MRNRIGFFVVCLVWLSAYSTPAATLQITWVGDKDYVTLNDLAKFYACDVSGPRSKKITLHNKGLNVAFDIESRQVQVNGTLVMLHEPMQLVKGRWVIRAADARKVVDPTVRPLAYLKNAGCRVIVLDPGHGGQDNGAQGRGGVQEKKAVLDIARRVRTYLVNAGLKVYMTRDGDRFVELEERCRKAKSWGADLFVSIHLNSAGSSMPHGTETYVLAAAGYESTAGGASRTTLPGNRFEGPNAVLGYSIHRSLTTKIGEGDRGVKRSRFLVLREAPCPAALVECLFLSNPAEEKRIVSDTFRESVAQGISDGIITYVKTVKRSMLTEP